MNSRLKRYVLKLGAVLPSYINQPMLTWLIDDKCADAKDIELLAESLGSGTIFQN
jgi:hypothetical protein